jgi:ATP-dependent Clp protease ATP-binding subunit ClpA
MNWFKTFWKSLTAPPSVADRSYVKPSSPKGAVQAKNIWKSTSQAEAISNFSPRAQQVLALSRTEADRLNHNFVGTEHLLLGFIALGQGAAWETLIALGLNLDAVRNEIENYVGAGPDQEVIGNIPYTPRVKKVLAFAAKEAKALSYTYVGTEHILLGLLREGDGVGARVLLKLGLDTEKARTEILKKRDQSRTFAAEQFESVPTETPLLPSLVNFTPRAQRALTLAREVATQRQQPVLGTEHLLLGLAKLGQGVAVTVMAKIGLNPETIASQIGKLPERPPAEKADEGPFYIDVRKALKSASEFARHLNHTYIGTEHILLGLLRQTDGGAAQIFKNLSIDTKKVGDEIFEELTLSLSAKGSAMQTKPSSEATGKFVDTSVRYDVYCVERNQKAVIYRNVLFKSAKRLFPRNDYDQSSDFVELEQSDGQKIFIAKSTIVRFCPAGAKPNVEDL